MNTIINLLEFESYKSVNKNLVEKKFLLQFLPKCLEQFSKNKNFYFNEKMLKSSYLIDIVHNLILKYYFKKENKFSLSSLILKEKYGHLYNYYMDFLLDKKVILLISKHRKGKNSRTYMLSEYILKQQISRFRNTDTFLIKKFKNKILHILSDESIDSKLIDSEVKVKLIDDLFSVDILLDRSIFYLDNIKQNDVDIYNRNRYSVDCIKDKHIFYHFDNYGRMHTNFTILKTYIRKACLTIDGHETYEIDIKNSQPLFLSKLIESSHLNFVDRDELDLFKYLTISGIYYDYIMEKLSISNKKCVKELTYKVLFGRNSTNSKSDKLFSSIFPTIHNFIKVYKKENKDYRILAYELQKAESNLIFNKIIKKIMTLHPEIKIITVHDSIIVPVKFKDSVNAIFYTKLYEEFGLI